MSAVGRWFVTPHAVQRYRERVDPSVSYEQALGALVHLSERAHFVKRREDGVECWRVGRADGHLRLRVQPQADGLPQLLTVLPAFNGCRPRRRVA